MRMEKKQKTTNATGDIVSVMHIPDIEYHTLMVSLSEPERELYSIAACLDGRYNITFNNDDIVSNVRFRYRNMILGERISEFLRSSEMEFENMFVPDSESPDLFLATMDRMKHRINVCYEQLLNSNGKIDAILNDINNVKQRDPTFKAIIISEGEHVGQYIKKRIGDQVGIMQRAKGRTSVCNQRVLLAFQEGKLDILVCSFESVRVGTNLEQAGAIYFMDTSIEDTEYKQACNRISRCGTRHTRLTATFVCVRETVSEEIYKYHEERRAGKTMTEALERFAKDEVHEYLPPRDFYNAVQTPASSTMHSFSSEHMFDDYYEITLSLSFLPATYEFSDQIIVVGKDKSQFRAVFDIPPYTGSNSIKLTTLTKLTDAEILNSIHLWNKPLPINPVKVVMNKIDGCTFPFAQNVFAFKASCSHCKWCGWRKLLDYDIQVCGSTNVSPTSKITLVDTHGNLRPVEPYQSAQERPFHQLHILNDTVKEYMKKGKESLMQIGVIPNRLTCNLLTKEFFSERPNVYQKVLVKLESANVNDTISFSYNGRQYKKFIREIAPVGKDWYAMAFVVQKTKPVTIIVIDDFELVDTTRVMMVGGDAFTLNDIIHIVRRQQDTVNITKLDAILQRTDIFGNLKLCMASKLISLQSNSHPM